MDPSYPSKNECGSTQACPELNYCVEGHEAAEAAAGEEQGDGGEQEDQEGREASQHLHEGGEEALPRR